ncbi:MAG: L-threonylcarbamoyladenylate synthase [bacterium]
MGKSVIEAARIVRDGGVVAFPTDTVYGLACDMNNVAAVRRIYAIKGRPAHMPLIIMLAAASQWELAAASASLYALEMMEKFWPGALTIILSARPDLPELVLGGGNTVGLRIPDHNIARELLHLAARPLATTSANRSGNPAPDTAAWVAEELGGDVDYILDGGQCPGGMASTVLNCAVEPPGIIRQGPITAQQLRLA